ncbi:MULTISPECIES: class I SAM-dependent methyltransferase [unclassified Bacillus (in: firmicutes)]|uniref:class I SAM-dependent methyltransferase n=1 Tax=unclassified Bacillus (in: firmicutes) TaxID=185979 RepID=UPI0003305412|nr:class I SAM-dependent methyltransferase [Bacillus wiedmannii]EOP09717.1 methyltransferase [Bacillus cereus BAG2O-3]EOQ12493.1 methyltransferase [Bacillus cereus B5-2]PEW50150.1 class I SAM-dependent methyltransferase [Bacillus cereus]PFW85512.1 class I SAM-dependent methyltransferase [Bacillus sp. AFS075960]RFB74874.1 class I SAM-dependent methyltransferase [Bacillus sp. AW]HDR8172386.1 class I SAM-dependent methyltransferase [Bacillus thuringiensis]
METYDWNSKLTYLKNTRDLYYNDDYVCFLINTVWKVTKPVHIVDYGCGYGYLGLILMPLLPEGSKYTGIDSGETLLTEARELFRFLPYDSEFLEGDATEIELNDTYDIAICHAFLLHMSSPKMMLEKMIQSIKDGGKIICFEPHWISNMSSYSLDGESQSEIIRLGVLQKLFESDTQRSGQDGNIGMKIPMYLSELGVKNIECRVSDKVNFLDSNIHHNDKNDLYHSLKEEGIAGNPGDKQQFIERLMVRGLTYEDALAQYEAELRFFKAFHLHSSLVYAPNMKITFGDKVC